MTHSNSYQLATAFDYSQQSQPPQNQSTSLMFPQPNMESHHQQQPHHPAPDEFNWLQPTADNFWQTQQAVIGLQQYM